jgi:DNA-binding beta-propeller fold protein YncE
LYDRVDKWTLNATASVLAMSVNNYCSGLFIDINDILYCSMEKGHKVVQTLNSISTSTVLVAGTGIKGSQSNMLAKPCGIFVDINFDLYVADSDNNRIQLFHLGQVNGITVAGNVLVGSITLNYPTGVVLDADNYLFIVDYDNSRIIASGPYGFRCIAGCSGLSGSASDRLSYPYTMAFDSYGNIFVTDEANNRVQKFILATNSCGTYESNYFRI